ncbi:hypothetical protein MAR_001032 [Mya arenaria]|uniref:Uncharacterized protein n=1 Tax=Mya arenaria TaxID=6604 RepID=A0ABY7FDE1_MYAAR|nr:hypothetical protein MAR_001032 [Mya arenaria]
MDICDSFSDACSPVDLAPCPPPDIDPHMFNDHLTARNLTRQVVLHIAERKKSCHRSNQKINPWVVKKTVQRGRKAMNLLALTKNQR